MKDFGQPVYAKGLEQRKTWYSSVADAYDQARPRYPEKIVDRALDLTGLSDGARILEVGCGPGTATTAFAGGVSPWSASNRAWKPANWHDETARAYPEVETLNTTLEEWEPGSERFDAVLAASAFHWVSSEIGYSKAADVLKDEGALILLWNTPPQPDTEVSQALKEVYEARAPHLAQPEDEGTQVQSLRGFEAAIIGSGRFGAPRSKSSYARLPTAPTTISPSSARCRLT